MVKTYIHNQDQIKYQHTKKIPLVNISFLININLMLQYIIVIVQSLLLNSKIIYVSKLFITQSPCIF